ncbi:cytosine permease [Glutamicibacter nicotianae]|nr:cytosine permease [Glutamicibacter nicotianae]
MEAGNEAEAAKPTAPGQRNWTKLATVGLSASTAVATWCFLLGGFVAVYLPAIPGMLTMIAGGLIGILVIFLALIPISTRYGVESIMSVKPALGQFGPWVVVIIAGFILVGWNSVLLIFMGRATAELLISTGLAPESARHVIMVVSALLGLLFIWWVLRKGPSRMTRVGFWIAAVVVVMAFWILYNLVSTIGWDSVVSAPALAPVDSKLGNLTIGAEMLIAVSLSWWPYVGGITQNLSSSRKAMNPVLLGLCLPLSLISIIGLFAALVFPDSGGDPTSYIIELSGVAVGVPILIFIVCANISTVMIGAYSMSLGVRQATGLNKELPWAAVLALSLIPVGFIVALMPDLLFDRIGTINAFVGLILAPICGVQIVDYYFLRKQFVSVRAIYSSSRDSAYWFWGGVNWWAFLALALGVATYLSLLNPITYETHPPFDFLTASLPSVVVAGAAHWVFTLLFVKPAGKGDYARSVEAAVLRG